MLLLIIIFVAIIGVIVALSKAVTALRKEDVEKSKTWAVIALVIVIVTWIIKLFYRLIYPNSDEDDNKHKVSHYILNEDYIFYESNLPKANFKKGDVVSGIVLKADATTGTITTAAQSQAIQSDYLFIMSAKISIPLTKLRYPSDTELSEIEGDIQKKLDSTIK